MSVLEPPRFTPAQILEAGNRAAGEGRLDFARQFFQHLIASYPGTPEANAAVQGLGRLPPLPGLAPQSEPAHYDPQLARGPAQAPFNVVPQPDPHFSHRQQPAGSHAGSDRRTLELPEPAHDYRTGRIIARLVTWLGGLLMLAGLALLPLAVLSPRTLAGLPFIGQLVSGPVVAGGAMLAGIVQIMMGQLVRALLDHANSARDIAAIARAQAAPPVRADAESRGRRR